MALIVLNRAHRAPGDAIVVARRIDERRASAGPDALAMLALLHVVWHRVPEGEQAARVRLAQQLHGRQGRGEARGLRRGPVQPTVAGEGLILVHLVRAEVRPQRAVAQLEDARLLQAGARARKRRMDHVRRLAPGRAVVVGVEHAGAGAGVEKELAGPFVQARAVIGQRHEDASRVQALHAAVVEHEPAAPVRQRALRMPAEGAALVVRARQHDARVPRLLHDVEQADFPALQAHQRDAHDVFHAERRCADDLPRLRPGLALVGGLDGDEGRRRLVVVLFKEAGVDKEDGAVRAAHEVALAVARIRAVRADVQDPAALLHKRPPRVGADSSAPGSARDAWLRLLAFRFGFT